MGIYDRDYIRKPQPRSGFGFGGGGAGGFRGGGGIGGIRMWSVNTWLIVICVLVFFVDGFFTPRLVTMQTVIRDARYANADPADMSVVDSQARRTGPAEWRAPIIDNETTEEIGFQVYQPMTPMQEHLHFSTSRGFFGFQFWRLIGFQFLHANMTHLLFNMIGLYFFGSLVEQYLGRKRYLAFYLLCGIVGALMYMLLNLGGMLAHSYGFTVPGLLFNSPSTPLIGASAGVYGVIMAGAFLAPTAMVLLFFVIPMRLRTLAYGIVAIAFLQLVMGAANAGGEAGHLGGALAGFYFIRRPHHLHGFFDILGRVDPTSHHYRKSKRLPRGAPPPRRRKAPNAKGEAGPSDAEIDRILAKVGQDGLHSLSDKEKQILRKASDAGG